ncbi:MAG TPA: YfhO family protein [Acidimicrobiales bacterium]|nr:YfhO family protein [Acidimicrobiales bacterium]
MTRDNLRRALRMAALRRTALPAAVFIACAFLLMPQAILGQRTYAGVDLLEAKSPYREALARPPHVESLVQTDQAEALAGRVSFFKALRNGTYQRWDPNLAGGQPSGTLPLNALLSPFSVGFLFLPAWYAIGLKVFLALLFCQSFMYLLVRRLGAAVGPAVLAGVAYTFSGVNLVFIHRVDAVFLVPALFWAVHRLIGAKADLRGAAVLGGFVAWAWAEGFPSGWVFCVYATAAWAAWLAVRAGGNLGDVVRRAVLPAVGLVWGVALAAVTLVPFVAEVLDRGTLDVRVGPGGGHIPSIQVFGLLDLSATGPPLSGPWWSGLNPVESVSHVGMIAAVAVAAGLLAAALGRISFTREESDAWLFFCGMAAVGVLVNFIGTPLLSVAERLPGIARNPIGRSRFLISLAVAVLGALALDAWWARRREPSTTPARVASAVTLAVLAGAFLLPVDDFFRTASAYNLLRHVTLHFALAILLAAAAVLIALNAVWRGSARAQAGATVVLAALLFAQLGWPLRHFTPEAPIGDFYGERAGHRALRALLDDRYRFAATEYNYYPNSGQALGLPDLRGLALHAKEFKNVVGAFNPQAFSRDALKINLRREEWNLTSPLLDHLAVRYFAEGGDELPFGRVADGADLTWDRWAPAKDLPAEMTSGVAPGPLNGIYVPLRATGKQCRGAFVTLTLRSGGGVVAETTRPAFDIGGWSGFAILARSLRAGDPYRFTATTNRPACNVDVGLTGPRAARQLLIEDPDQAVRLVSTEQSWIYERPSAWPLVSVHGRWRSFPDQASLLAWAATRPPEDADVAPFVGEGQPATPPGAPAPRLLSSRISDNTVRAEVAGAAGSLLVVSQNLADGWKAEVDGKPAPIVPVDGALIGVFVPPGQHTVTLDYLPRTFVAGAGITGAAVVAAGLAVWMPVGRRRRTGRVD